MKAKIIKLRGKTDPLSDYTYIVPLLGDSNILLSLIKSDTLLAVVGFFRGDPRAWVGFFKNIVGLGIYLAAFSVRVYLRTAHGISTIGWILTWLTAMMLLAFNYRGLPWVLAPFAAFFAPVHEIIAHRSDADTWHSWWPDALELVRSDAMWYFFLGFCILAVANIFISYFTITNDSSNIKRGIFWPLLLVKNNNPSPKHWRWFVLETAIVAIAGAIFFFGCEDWYFGVYLFIAAACHLALEGYEYMFTSPANSIPRS